jgi:hypothetical protein
MFYNSPGYRIIIKIMTDVNITKERGDETMCGEAVKLLYTGEIGKTL